MANNKIVLNKQGVRELLQSEETQEMLRTVASDVSARLGDGYQVQQAYVGRNRANIEVMAVSEKAKRDNLKHNTLLKAL